MIYPIYTVEIANNPLSTPVYGWEEVVMHNLYPRHEFLVMQPAYCPSEVAI